jgi:hypothetical protein
MNFMRTRIAALLPVLLILTGCASFLERTVYERSQHFTQDTASIGTAFTANSPDTLKSAIIGVIRGGRRDASIHVTDYPGGLTRLAVSAIIRDIQTEEPIGAFAVDYVALDLTQVLSQYIVTLNIVYNHDTLPVILPVSGGRELEAAVHTALSGYQTLLTVEMPYFYAREHDVESMIRSYYYNNPVWAMEYPDITINLYPSSGESLRRIIELKLDWNNSGIGLMRKASDTKAAAEYLLEALPEFMGNEEEQTAQVVLWLHNALCGAAEYDADTAMLAAETGERVGGDPYTAYGALVGGLAVSEGYAMAFKLLCDMLGIESVIVTGSRNGESHAWNLVRIGGIWYHIGVAFDDRGSVPRADYFLFDDESAAGRGFEWQENRYPAALPGFWTAENILFLMEDREYTND